MMGRAVLLAVLACTGGCATMPAAPDPALASADPLVSAAALLVAAEGARGPAERAPLIARLDDLGVNALPDLGEDRLAEWRAQTPPAAAPVFRGRTLGPGYRRAQLAAGERLVLDQVFYAGERAELAAQARGGQPVVLAITNPQSQNVCEAQLTPHARCRWLPIYTERFQITLVNRGETPASVYLVFD
jgi:hypothetical protein